MSRWEIARKGEHCREEEEIQEHILYEVAGSMAHPSEQLKENVAGPCLGRVWAYLGRVWGVSGAWRD